MDAQGDQLQHFLLKVAFVEGPVQRPTWEPGKDELEWPVERSAGRRPACRVRIAAKKKDIPSDQNDEVAERDEYAKGSGLNH